MLASIYYSSNMYQNYTPWQFSFGIWNSETITQAKERNHHPDLKFFFSGKTSQSWTASPKIAVVMIWPMLPSQLTHAWKNGEAAFSLLPLVIPCLWTARLLHRHLLLCGSVQSTLLKLNLQKTIHAALILWGNWKPCSCFSISYGCESGVRSRRWSSEIVESWSHPSYVWVSESILGGSSHLVTLVSKSPK